MAGRAKQWWKIGFRNVGVRLVHQREGNAFTGAEYMVHLDMTLERDPTRMLTFEMDAQYARFLSNQLARYADRAEELNQNL